MNNKYAESGDLLSETRPTQDYSEWLIFHQHEQMTIFHLNRTLFILTVIYFFITNENPSREYFPVHNQSQ